MKLIDVEKISDRGELVARLAALHAETPLTIQDVAVVLHLSPKHIWRQIVAGNDGSRVPQFYRLAGARAWLVSAGALRRWLRAQQGDATITEAAL